MAGYGAGEHGLDRRLPARFGQRMNGREVFCLVQQKVSLKRHVYSYPRSIHQFAYGVVFPPNPLGIFAKPAFLASAAIGQRHAMEGMKADLQRWRVQTSRLGRRLCR